MSRDTNQQNQVRQDGAGGRAGLGRAGAQPLAALELPAALLQIRTVEAVTGLSRSTIYRMLAAGNFPAPVRFGSRCTRWPAGSVRDWLQRLTEQKAMVID